MCNIQCRQLSSQPLEYQIVLLKDINHSLTFIAWKSNTQSLFEPREALNWSCFLWMSHHYSSNFFCDEVYWMLVCPSVFFVSFFLRHVCFKFWLGLGFAGSFFPDRTDTVFSQHTLTIVVTVTLLKIQLSTVNFSQIRLNTHQVLLLISRKHSLNALAWNTV